MKNDAQKKIFAERLNKALKRSGLTARELGKQAGIDEANICRYRKGYAVPARGKIFFLAETLGVSSSWLLGLSASENEVLTSEKGALTPEDRLRAEIREYMETMSKEQLEDAEDLIKRFILRR